MYLSVGAYLEIELATNPTTGFDWYLEGTAPACLSLNSSTYEQDAKTIHRVGAPSVKRIIYKAESICSGDLRFKNVRPWEENKEPQGRVSIHVTTSASEL